MWSEREYKVWRVCRVREDRRVGESRSEDSLSDFFRDIEPATENILRDSRNGRDDRDSRDGGNGRFQKYQNR